MSSLTILAILNFLDLFGTVFIKFRAILLLKSVHMLQVKFDFRLHFFNLNCNTYISAVPDC